MRVEQLTCAIGAELVGVSLADAARDDGLFAAIKAELLKHKVLFLRDQDISRADHVAFARRFGELEDHPVAGSDPDHPGLVRIYKSPDHPNDRYENSWHTDATNGAGAARAPISPIRAVDRTKRAVAAVTGSVMETKTNSPITACVQPVVSRKTPLGPEIRSRKFVVMKGYSGSKISTT